MISTAMLLNIANQQSIKERIKSLAVKWITKSEVNNITIKDYINNNIKIYKDFDRYQTPYGEMKGIILSKNI